LLKETVSTRIGLFLTAGLYFTYQKFTQRDGDAPMKTIKFTILFIAVVVSGFFMMTGLIVAQPPGDANGDQGAGQMQGGRGGMQVDPEQMQQMMAQRYQEVLGMSDEEWAVIGPYVLKVVDLSSSTQSRGSGMRMMMGGRGNMPGDGSDEDTSQDQSRDDRRSRMRGEEETEDENLAALETLLEDENATSGEIKVKLSALRKAREQAKQELVAAQKQLRELLTLRQEAMLVVMGLLE
jgi:Spy/CpxP family protein refolding chaperone